MSRIRAGVELVQPALQRVQRAKDLLPQAIDACSCAAVPVAVRTLGIQRRRTAVHDEQLARADRIIDCAQRAEAQLLHFGERRLVGAAAGALVEDALQPRAAIARDLELARSRF